MHRTKRIAVTLSPAMLTALELLAERSGLSVSTQAMVVLRAGLDRTIHSTEGQERIRAARASFTRDERIYEATTDRLVENTSERALAASGNGEA